MKRYWRFSSFTIGEPPDGKWGNLDKTNGEWTGMVRQLLDKVSQQHMVAICTAGR